jgi:CRISPR/Cas system-associated endoribonuclease Cas2
VAKVPTTEVILIIVWGFVIFLLIAISRSRNQAKPKILNEDELVYREDNATSSNINKLSNIESEPRAKSANVKRCPNCRCLLDKLALKCRKCGRWIDNSVFENLDPEDSAKIKSKDLFLVTPSLICLIISDLMQTRITEIEIATSDRRNLLNLIWFECYCYSRVLRIFTHTKKGKADILKKEIDVALISLVTSQLENMMSGSTRFPPHTHNTVLNLFDQLDIAYDKYIGKGDMTAGLFMIGDSWGALIYKESSIFDNLQLVTNFNLYMKNYSEVSSQYFVVEEADFNWRALFNS